MTKDIILKDKTMKRKVINIEFEDVNTLDYPDFSDAFIVYAEYEDGTPLTICELDALDIGDYHDLIYESLI
jgi:hypothetical protein